MLKIGPVLMLVLKVDQRVIQTTRARHGYLAQSGGCPDGQRRRRLATHLRLVSIFYRSWMTILVALFTQAPLPLGVFLPGP
jgi:hypothetical protein